MGIHLSRSYCYGSGGSQIDLPSKPGVYLFKQKNERVLYVGKANNLKERVKSYFSKKPDRAMIPKLVTNSEKIDFIVTQNPSEALVLERELIRKHKPKYNSRLKDDKSFPFISLTNEEFLEYYTQDSLLKMTNVGVHSQMQVLQRELYTIKKTVWN